MLVTGSSSGIGASTAQLLASEGALVAVHYRRHEDRALKLVGDITKAGGHAVALRADLLDGSSRRALVPQAIAALGGLDALVNNAGRTIGPGTVVEISETSWRDTFTLNVEAPFFLAQQAFAHMQQNGGGKIINISSIGVKYGGSPTTLHYTAAKSALETVTLGLAKAGAPFGILANVIRPGVIQTPVYEDTPLDVMARRIEQIPLRRAGTPDDIAQMVVYLLSRAGDYITGQTFSITGGD